jgi:hypothetical protein
MSAPDSAALAKARQSAILLVLGSYATGVEEGNPLKLCIPKLHNSAN